MALDERLGDVLREEVAFVVELAPGDGAVCVREPFGSAFASLIDGAAGLFAFYLILALVKPGGMGFGDVKLAAVLGLYLGFLGWGNLLVGAFAAFLFGGVFGLLLMLAHRAGRKTAIPFGPWMIAGAWVGVFAGEFLANAYFGAVGVV